MTNQPDGAFPNSERWNSRHVISEVVKNWVEVLALCVAGIWALLVFGLQTLPVREKQFDSQAKLTWLEGPAPDTCIADWYVLVKNISSRSLTVRRIDVHVWKFELPVPLATKAAYIDVDTYRPAHPEQYLYSREFEKSSDPLVDEYA